MIYKGYNARVDDSDLDDSSPDLSNCFHHDNTPGLLGQRKGKTFHNSTQYTSDGVGMIPFRLPNLNRRILIANTNGGIDDIAAPLATDTSPTGVSATDGDQYSIAASTLTLTGNSVEDYDYASATFTSSATFSGETGKMAVFGFPTVMEFSSDADDDSIVIHLGFKTSGGYDFGSSPTFQTSGNVEFITPPAGTLVTIQETEGWGWGGQTYTGLAIKAATGVAGATVSYTITIPGYVYHR